MEVTVRMNCRVGGLRRSSLVEIIFEGTGRMFMDVDDDLQGDERSDHPLHHPQKSYTQLPGVYGTS